MPPHRRLCSLASGIVTIFFCLSFLAHQLDPRQALFAPDIHPFSANPPRPQPLLTLLNMTHSLQAQLSNVQPQGVKSGQTPNYYAQGTQTYQQGYGFPSHDPRQTPNFQPEGVEQSRQTRDSYVQRRQDPQQGSNFHPQRVLNSQPEGRAYSQHASYSHLQHGFLTQDNDQTRGHSDLANPHFPFNSQPQQLLNQADSHHTSNSQPHAPVNSPYTSNSEPQEPLNSADLYHTPDVQSHEFLNPLSSHHSSHTQVHQPLNFHPKAPHSPDLRRQAHQEPSVQAQALQQIQQSQSLHQTNSQTRPYPYPHNMAHTPTSTLNPGLNQPTNNPQSTLNQSSQSPKSTPIQSSISFRSNRGLGQCKKKYWRCDSPPTDPEPPLEDLQELEDLPEHPFTVPHWTQYVDRGYSVLDRNQSASKRLPDVLIIGAKKSGTRALLAFLRVHPSIRASGPEVHYFDRFYARGLDWYRSKLPLSLAWQLTVEKTPAYFTSAGVPARVKQDLPGAKLLLVVRDPVTRALSDYTQSLR